MALPVRDKNEMEHTRVKYRFLIPVLFSALMWVFLLFSCMEYGPRDIEEFGFSTDGSEAVTGEGLFIINEGNYKYDNASLSYYEPATGRIENEVFVRANGIKLGDVAQSMIIRDGVGWVVVNDSGVIYAIDAATFKLVGLIEGFTAPRYIHFVDDGKAYVTQIWDNRICIVDPREFRIVGYVDCPDMTAESGSTEQMVQYGKYVFTNCWSYQNRILVIDTETDKVCDRIEVGLQPTSLVLDRFGKLWVLTDGGHEGSPYGYEAPTLCRIDAESRQIEKVFRFPLGDRLSELQINGTRDTLYYIDDSVWKMSVTAERLPIRAFIESGRSLFYGLTVNPVNSEVYVADAVDYMQDGVVSRYSAEGKLLDQFYVGITPGAFCWR